MTTLITVIIGIAAVCVTIVPITLMIISEHRNLHGEASAWLRRHGRRPESVLDLPRMYNQTTDEEHQELV